MKRYRVLWVDDQPEEEFMNEAYENDLDIDVATCYEEAQEKLNDAGESWDAIILDANCKLSRDEYEAPSLESLQESISYLNKLCTERFIPWFVYTGGAYEGFSALGCFISRNRDWDDRKYYNKPQDRYALFENLKKAADNSRSTYLKHKYADVWNVYMHDDLLPILDALENDVYTNSSVFNEIRKILDWVMKYCFEHGVLPIEFDGSNLGECSKILGDKKMTEYVPIHVQRSLHSCVEISNEGSHRLSINQFVQDGKAPYLVKSTIYELLNILHWCGTLSSDDYDISMLSVKIKSLFKKEAIGQEMTGDALIEGIIEKDEKNNYHCGSCLLSYQQMKEEDVGKRIRIKKTKVNTNIHSSEMYQLVAFRNNCEIEE